VAQDHTNRINILTVAGLAAVAYVVSTMAHEGLGHGGTCLLTGAHLQSWGAYYVECDAKAQPDWVFRAVAAAGSTVNLILALLFGGLVSARLAQPGRRGSWTVFLWLMFSVNAFTWAGYFCFSGVAGLGDWGDGPDAFLYQVPNALIWRIAMFVCGLAIYIWLARLSMRFLARIVGNQIGAARKISLTAYATGGLLGLCVGLMNPVGIVIVLISSLASSLGGTSGLMWGLRMLRGEPVEADYDLPFNIVWLVLGVVAAAGFAVILGPTLKFA
jgi:hypothetical protein